MYVNLSGDYDGGTQRIRRKIAGRVLNHFLEVTCAEIVGHLKEKFQINVDPWKWNEPCSVLTTLPMLWFTKIWTSVGVRLKGENEPITVVKGTVSQCALNQLNENTPMPETVRLSDGNCHRYGQNKRRAPDWRQNVITLNIVKEREKTIECAAKAKDIVEEMKGRIAQWPQHRDHRWPEQVGSYSVPRTRTTPSSLVLSCIAHPHVFWV